MTTTTSSADNGGGGSATAVSSPSPPNLLPNAAGQQRICGGQSPVSPATGTQVQLSRPTLLMDVMALQLWHHIKRVSYSGRWLAAFVVAIGLFIGGWDDVFGGVGTHKSYASLPHDNESPINSKSLDYFLPLFLRPPFSRTATFKAENLRHRSANTETN
ncbi:hypothetical protein AVEN_155988-1 [Araneus ventricosus]|uniref:Uncharacterized protein n=1 Tax=Araneus ventricosus TaxID=182803 RepID=A0A4Y2JGM1_ARAVE|nr:hypothetical protein AVEN_155988-1 [Araneus ventricosus]